MQIIVILAVVILCIAFIAFLRNIHSTHTTGNHAVAKIYVDGHVIEFTPETLIIDSQPNNAIHLGHFEELIEVLNRCALYKEIYMSNKIYVAINNLIAHKQLVKYIHPEKFSVSEPTNFRSELQYGGCFFENSEGSAMVHAIGRPNAVLNMCSSLLDTEEILRVSGKWEKQNFLVLGVATGDVYGDKKNVLTRGVKEKMTFLGLLAIENT